MSASDKRVRKRYRFYCGSCRWNGVMYLGLDKCPECDSPNIRRGEKVNDRPGPVAESDKRKLRKARRESGEL